jgi:L-fucose isomerase-like protein
VDVFRSKPEQFNNCFVLKKIENLKDEPVASCGPFSFYYLTADQPNTVKITLSVENEAYNDYAFVRRKKNKSVRIV